MASVSFTLNGAPTTVTVADTNMPLLWVLRDILNLTGTKYGCGAEYCGACTVLINGQREHSCVFNVGSAGGKTVVTVEGLANDKTSVGTAGRAVQKAWVDNQVPQCGFCQPGMVMVTTGSILAGRHGSQIASDITHICQCGTYQRIKTAISGL